MYGHSAQGVSLTSNISELVAYTITVAYNLRLGTPAYVILCVNITSCSASAYCWQTCICTPCHNLPLCLLGNVCSMQLFHACWVTMHSAETDRKYLSACIAQDLMGSDKQLPSKAQSCCCFQVAARFTWTHVFFAVLQHIHSLLMERSWPAGSRTLSSSASFFGSSEFSLAIFWFNVRA